MCLCWGVSDYSWVYHKVRCRVHNRIVSLLFAMYRNPSSSSFAEEERTNKDCWGECGGVDNLAFHVYETEEGF